VSVPAGYLEPTLAQGIATLSQNQQVSFQLYRLFVLPLDGYVFWVADGTVPPLSAQGSLHFQSSAMQTEADSATVNSVIFTTKTPLDQLLAIAPGTMWVGTFNGVQFAFRESGMNYRAAGIYHYRGDAIYAPLTTQLIGLGQSLPDSSQAIVSNSLPAFLALTAMPFPVFPSFAVPANQAPPYVAVHIDPNQTTALQPIPFIDSTSSSWQLAHDMVKLTLYGMTSNQAIDYLNYLIAQCTDTGPFGLMNGPIIRDEKQIEREFQILAQRKTITLEVSYYQSRIQDIARQLIEQAILTCTLSVNPT